LVHLYNAKKFGSPRNYIADEGYCTYLGGSGELSLDELLIRLRKYIENEPQADILRLFTSDFQIDGEHSSLYVISGLLMRAIEREHGMKGVKQIINAENGLEGYFEALDGLLGIHEQNFSEKVQAMLTTGHERDVDDVG